METPNQRGNFEKGGCVRHQKNAYYYSNELGIQYEQQNNGERYDVECRKTWYSGT
jgi:hypothetical protein